MLGVVANESNHRILRVRCRGCVPSVELRRHLCLKNIPVLLVQRRLRWFGHDRELINALRLPTQPTEDIGNYDQRRPGDPIRTASLQLHTIDKGWGESLH